MVSRWLALIASVSVLGLIWLVWLPGQADRPAMRRHLQWLDDRGIDPSAMYYTELDVMRDILKRHRIRQINEMGYGNQSIADAMNKGPLNIP